MTVTLLVLVTRRKQMVQVPPPIPLAQGNILPEMMRFQIMPSQHCFLEEGTATHSSVLAWRIPRTEEPGGPQSTRSPRVGHA